MSRPARGIDRPSSVQVTNQQKSSSEKTPTEPTSRTLPARELDEKRSETNDTQSVTPTIPSQAAHEIEIGDLFEQQGRLEDAEKAYAKALETATGTERDDARRRLQQLLQQESGVKARYFDPWFEKFGASFSGVLFGVLGAVPALLLLWGSRSMLRFVGGFFGKKKLQIGSFVDATGRSAGLAFAELMKNAIEEVKEYYKPRDRFLHGAFGSLVVVESPGSEELVELAAEVVPGGWSKFLGFMTKGLYRPEYFISGMIQEAGFHYGLLIRLLRNGATIRTWQLTVPARDLSRFQDDLALDVALYLKEVVEAKNGS